MRSQALKKRAEGSAPPSLDGRMRPSPHEFLEVFAQLGEAAYDEQLLIGRRGIEFFVLKNPGIAMRDENRVQTRSQRGIDVGLRTVANHPGGVVGQVVFVSHAGIYGGILLWNDFD